MTVCSAAIACLTACGDNVLTDSRQIVFPESNVSYTKQVQPLFDLSCNFVGCHNRDNPARGISFASYFDVMNRPGLVIAGKPDQSLLIQIVDTSNAASRLHPPSFQSRITANQIRGLRTWVKEGAQLN